jgi:hypothetical protein
MQETILNRLNLKVETYKSPATDIGTSISG